MSPRDLVPASAESRNPVQPIVLPATYGMDRLSALARNGRHRAAVGSLWEEMGDLILRYLVNNGMRPTWNVLDIGCGALRAGVRLVDFLDPDHYFGMDANEDLIDVGYSKELAEAGLTDRLSRNHLVVGSSFDFERLPSTSFDVAIANSVFSHLPIDRLRHCLVKLAPMMSIGSEFHATMFLCPDKVAIDGEVIHQPGGIVTYPDRNPFHYRWRQVERAVLDLPWMVCAPRDWGHPRAQKMVRFVRMAA